MTCSVSTASEQMIELKKLWLDQVRGDLDTAANAIDTLASPDVRDVAETSESLFRVFHDMQGQAAVFDYPLLAAIATKFCGYWRPIKKSPAVGDVSVARAHLVAARFVLEKQLEGCGGAAGPSITAKLDAIINTHG